MPGLNEILLIVLIIGGLFILPRIMGRGRETMPVTERQPVEISGPMRLAIAASMLWLAAAALYLEPWKGNTVLFLVLGPGPIVLAWAANWVRAGFKKSR